MSTHGNASPTRFVLIRHGEAEGNREMRYLGTTDAPLTPLGQTQAVQLAQAAAVFLIVAIYTSPLVRAWQTAEALAALGDLRVMKDDRLREEAFGDWENRTRAEVQASDAVQLAAWESGDETAPPGGESLAQVRERALACADALAAAHPGQTVALVSHVGPIKMLVCAALGLPPSGARRMWLDPASICVVDWRGAAEGSDPDERTGVLRVYNAVAHLDPPVRWLAKA